MITTITRAAVDSLTAEEASLVCHAINRFGDACHPLAERDRLSSFAASYAIACIKHMKRRNVLKPSGIALADAAAKKIGVR